MSPETLPTGPDPEAITRYILKTYPDTDIVTIEGGSFFSLDPEAHWPKSSRPSSGPTTSTRYRTCHGRVCSV